MLPSLLPSPVAPTTQSTMTTKEKEQQQLSPGQDNARGHVATVCNLYAKYMEASITSDAAADEVAEEAQELALSVQVQSGWQTPGQQLSPEEGCILLTTGGPALRLLVELDVDAAPCGVELQWADWGTPWQCFPLTEAEDQAMAWFAEQFWYGEA